ncbi:MAG: extracellular solute-binding protein [Clostridia bacterium]|nr:extracellular solute-binding protein [Clostridia bacterium]
MLKRIQIWITAAALLAMCLLSHTASFAALAAPSAEEQPVPPTTVTMPSAEYEQYLTDKTSAPADAVIEVAGTAFSSYAEFQPEITEIEGVSAATTDVWGSITYTFTVEKSGLYDLDITYYPLDGYGDTIERVLYLDGEIPYSEARSLLFQRRFEDEGDKRYSTSGNEYRRDQAEIFAWYTTPAHSGYGFVDSPLKFYLTEGTHTLTLESVAEPMAIGSLRFFVRDTLPTYAEVVKQYQAAGLKKGSGQSVYEAEDASGKSAQTLYAVEDRSSCVTTPYEPTLILLNCIGSNNWKYRGQWIEWTVTVPEEGLYTLSFRTKQDFVSGASASRRLTVNGEVPFKEAETLRVPFDLSWQMFTPGNADGAYLFHLNAGDNTIRLEVVTGELAPVLTQVSNTVEDLTALYRRMTAIIGSFPDPLRDYHLEDSIPDMVSIMETAHSELTAANKLLEKLSGTKGEQSAYIDQMLVLLETMLKKKDVIPEQLGTFSDRINALSSWAASASEVPLLIDKVIVSDGESKLPRTEGNFFQKIWFAIVNFFASFTVDYYTVESMVEVETDREITLWLAGNSGRDQASILRDLVDKEFTANTGIRLNIRLVNMGVLWQAVASDVGPDVAIFQGQAAPLNYGVRGALYDLSQFENCDEVLSRFAESAVTPFRLGDSVYALPEQQVFMMMFTRTDILGELNLTTPQTWDDMYALIPTLQEQGMEIGLPLPTTVQSGSDSTALNPMYTSLLLQNGASVYDEDNRLCVLDDLKAVNCFVEWSEYYTKYNFTKSYSPINRFRTGTMPIVLSDYTFYNQLVLAAPEIDGAWEMTPIPGILQEDGSICRNTSSSGSAAMIFANTDDPDASWEFLKWWTEADTQVQYGRELETIQGASARWPTANLEAMEQLGWTRTAAAALKEQWQYVYGIPEVPGGYYVGRTVSNAIKSTINMGENPRESILDAVEDINEEILSKREEFGLEGSE